MDIHQIAIPSKLVNSDLFCGLQNNFSSTSSTHFESNTFYFLVSKTTRLHFDEENQYYYLLNGIIENNSNYIKKLMIYKYSSSGRLIKTFIQKIYCHKEFFFESPSEFFV